MVHVNTGALTELFSCGKSGTPVIVPLSSGELLLSKQNVGIFIGADGKPSRKVPSVGIFKTRKEGDTEISGGGSSLRS